MSWIKHTGARYHTQDTGYYCGAACAMMILNEIGVPYADLDQDDLYTSNHDHNAVPGDAWYTDPYGLRYTLVDRRPAGFTNTFVVHKPLTEAEGTRDIVYTLWRYGVSPSVLVFHCQHWIVVPGVQTDVEPATGASYTVEGFWVHNPVHKDNEPHGAIDSCGTGGAEGNSNEFVTYLGWQTTYFTGCAYDSPGGEPQYISVCDPDVPKIALPRRVEPVRYFDGRSIIDGRKISDVLVREIDRLSLREAKQTQRVARAKFGAPRLVQRLDVEGSYYYLVPALEGTDLIGYAQVDARYGGLESLYTLKRSAKAFETDPRKVEQRLAGTRIELPNERGRLRLVKGKFRVERNLVWRPCRQAFSPHLPFWRINAEPFTFYQRIDGPVFAQLTLNGKGI